MKRIHYFFLSLFFMSVPGTYAQKIENVDFTVKDNVISVTYDLAECKPHELYDIKLLVICDGRSIDPIMLSGDLKKVSCGSHKKIEWNVLADNIEMKGKTQVIVNISKTYSTKVNGGPENALLSVILPGVGDYFVNKSSKSWYYISALYLGAAYYAFSNKMQSNAAYSKYHSASTQADMDSNYKTAYDKNQNFQLLVGAMATIWLADVIYVGVKGSQNRAKQLNGLTYREPKTKFYLVGTPKTVQLGFIKKF